MGRVSNTGDNVKEESKSSNSISEKFLMLLDSYSLAVNFCLFALIVALVLSDATVNISVFSLVILIILAAYSVLMFIMFSILMFFPNKMTHLRTLFTGPTNTKLKKLVRYAFPITLWIILPIVFISGLVQSSNELLGTLRNIVFLLGAVWIIVVPISAEMKLLISERKAKIKAKQQEFDADGERKKKIVKLSQKLSKATDSHVAFLQNRLWQMINYAIGRLDYYEEYRRRYLQIGLASIGLAVTVFALIGRSYFLILSDDPQKLMDWHIGSPFLAILIVVASLGWVGIRQVYLYMAYSSPEYPYRGVTQPDWFYRYTKKSGKQEFLRRTKFSESEEDQNIVIQLQQMFLEDLEQYGKRLTGRSPKDALINDVEQLMALHTLTEYKQSQTTEMRNKLWFDIRALLVVLGIAVIVIALALILNNQGTNQGNELSLLVKSTSLIR